MQDKTLPALPALQPTSSSLIKAIGFENGALYLQFGRKLYRYTGDKVAQHHSDLMAAESLGKHFLANVKNCPDTTYELVHTFEDTPQS
jgi:hypothetical protein